MQRPNIQWRRCAGRSRTNANKPHPRPELRGHRHLMILSLALEAPREARHLQRQAQLLGGCRFPRSFGMG
eukprot:4105333-Alexandrium_andersonii.AAC.1